MKILATGIDIVEVNKVKEIYSKFGRKFLTKVLKDEEIRFLEEKKKGFYQSLAGRIAAKEAVYKALNSYDKNIRPRWKEMTIHNQENGSPVVIFNPGYKFDFQIVLSVSHSDKYAVANALLIQ
jgi:holo-[acyl-carrier protein] synthase